MCGGSEVVVADGWAKGCRLVAESEGVNVVQGFFVGSGWTLAVIPKPVVEAGVAGAKVAVDAAHVVNERHQAPRDGWSEGAAKDEGSRWRKWSSEVYGLTRRSRQGEGSHCRRPSTADA